MEELFGIDRATVNNLNIKILHRHWKSAFAETYLFMTTAKPGEVISLYGPSRSGKTSLLLEVIQAVCGGLPSNPDEEPLVMITVDNTGGHASFSFKGFIQEMLEIIDHPIYAFPYTGGCDDITSISRFERVTEKMWTRILIRALKQRKTRYWVVDEAQDVKYAGKDVLAASGVMDALKTIAHKAEVVLVVVGTYPVLQSMNRSSHFENRKHDVHLARYRNTEEDLKEFLWILSNYDAVLELDPSLGSLQNVVELLYRGSFGCIGLISAWLYRASVLAATENKKISLCHIERSMKAPNQLVTGANEIRVGETLLGLDECVIVNSVVSADKPSKGKGRKSKPFQRNPKRYEAGNRE